MKSPCRDCDEQDYKARCFDSCKLIIEFRQWLDRQPDGVPASDATQDYRILPQ